MAVEQRQTHTPPFAINPFLLQRVYLKGARVGEFLSSNAMYDKDSTDKRKFSGIPKKHMIPNN